MEWNRRYIIGKILQKCTSSLLTSIARYGLQELQNRLRRGGEKVKEDLNYTEHLNAHCMKKPVFKHKEEKSGSYTGCSNAKNGHDPAFEHYEEKPGFKP